VIRVLEYFLSVVEKKVVPIFELEKLLPYWSEYFFSEKIYQTDCQLLRFLLSVGSGFGLSFLREPPLQKLHEHPFLSPLEWLGLDIVESHLRSFDKTQSSIKL
jgi:hypothetical protein